MSELDNIQYDFLDIYTTLSPLLFTYYRKSNYYILFGIIPSAIKILFKLINPIKRLCYATNNEPKMVSKAQLTLMSRSFEDGVNSDYVSFSWWLQSNRVKLGIDKLSISGYYTACVKHNVSSYNNYLGITGDRYTFEHNGKEYTIKLYTENEEDKNKNSSYNTITVESDDINDCLDLIHNAVKEHREFIRTINSNGEYIYTFRQTIDEWLQKKINVTKTKDNVFVEEDIDIFDQLDNFCK